MGTLQIGGLQNARTRLEDHDHKPANSNLIRDVPGHLQRSVDLLDSFHIRILMTEISNQALDEDVKRGIRKLRELLKDPAKFERWANETLDLSRLRKH